MSNITNGSVLLKPSNVDQSITFVPSTTMARPNISFQAAFTLSPTGSLLVQATDDNTNWCTIASTMNVSGSQSESHIIAYPHQSFAQIRMLWSSGGATSTGTISLSFNANE